MNLKNKPSIKEISKELNRKYPKLRAKYNKHYDFIQIPIKYNCAIHLEFDYKYCFYLDLEDKKIINKNIKNYIGKLPHGFSIVTLPGHKDGIRYTHSSNRKKNKASGKSALDVAKEIYSSYEEIWQPIIDKINDYLFAYDSDYKFVSFSKIYADESLNDNKPQKSKNEISRKVTEFPRDNKQKIHAIKKNDYKCEVDPSHKSFLIDEKHNYMEGHHLIPMKNQKDFPKNDIDVWENIVCLCPNCHKKIHYGLDEERKKLIKKLFSKERKKYFNRLQIRIDELKLLEMYNITK